MTLNVAAIAALKARLVAARDGEARAILTVAQERIPVETGAAHDSGRVVSDGDTSWITFGKDDDGGGSHSPSNQYIEVLHENMEMRHPHGGQAKFLQSAGDDAVAGMAARIAERARI